jgi:hypothetical protein
MSHNNNYNKHYSSNKKKYNSLKKQRGGYTCEYYIKKMMDEEIPKHDPLYTHSNNIGFRYINNDNGRRNNAITCGIAYVLAYRKLLDLDNKRAKLIIDGMNIIRNKYILMLFLAETMNYNSESKIIENIFTLIRNPVAHNISLDLIILLLPIIITLLNVHDTDIYITFQSPKPILMKYNSLDLKKHLEKITRSSRPNSNLIYLLGVACYIDDGIGSIDANPIECYQNKDKAKVKASIPFSVPQIGK